MKLCNFFFAAVLVGTLAIVGCGDDGGSSGGGNGGGEELCNTGNCVNDPDQRAVCEEACRKTPGNCEFLARDLCL